MPTPFIKRTRDNAVAEFTSLRPIDPQTFQPVIEPIDRPNVDGYTFRKQAKKGEPWRVRAVRDFTNLSSARAAVQELRNGLVGELCEITTRDNTTYGRMMCLKVTEIEVHEALQVIGGLAATGSAAIFESLGGTPTAIKGIAYVDVLFVHASAPPAGP